MKDETPQHDPFTDDEFAELNAHFSRIVDDVIDEHGEEGCSSYLLAAVLSFQIMRIAKMTDDPELNMERWDEARAQCWLAMKTELRAERIITDMQESGDMP